ncbi:MAG: hypothetical protein RLZZ546_2202, partial [Bacteroidota bacterium]
FSINSKGYLGTGIGPTGEKRDFWEYNPSSNVWTQKSDFGGTPRFGAVGFSLASKGYIGTGNDGSIDKKDFWEYDPSTDNWTQKSNFGGVARNGAVGFAFDTKGYIGGKIKDFWEYDPIQNHWTQMSDFDFTSFTDGFVGFSILSDGYIGNGNFWIFKNKPGKFYSEKLPINVIKYQDHDWTSEGNQLYPSLDYAKIQLKSTNGFEFGSMYPGKEKNAGKIGYNTFSTNALDIVGAGTTYPNRNVKIFDRLYFDNILQNRKIVLYETQNNDSQFFGFGINGATLRYNVSSNADRHSFFSGANLAMSIQGRTNSTNAHSGSILFNNSLDNRKLVLWDNNVNSNTNFFGMGINSGTLRFQIPASENLYRWCQADIPIMDLFGNGDLYIANQGYKPGGGSWAASSDIRVKKNITKYNTGLDQLLKIQPVSFQYNGKGNTSDNGKIYVGVIAQEIEKILPSTISTINTGEINDLRTYDSSELTYTIINAIKELNVKNEDLKKENEELKMENEKLKVKIEKLEEKINSFDTFKAEVLKEIELLKHKNNKS